MDREQFLERVKTLRAEGESIRAIASELGVHRSSVQRALQTLSPTGSGPSISSSRRVSWQNGPAGSVFVGRHYEMAELKTALEDSLSGQVRLVMLAGEPGIGKTRTAQELAAYAANRGAQVLWGRYYEDMGTPPYRPWVQAIHSYVQTHHAEELRSVMGVAAADIAAIVPDLRETMPDLRSLPVLEPEQSRLRLFDSITAFLKAAATTQPLALIIDNLHWADRPSLLLLEFLAQELRNARLLFVGTYRDVDLSREHPLSQTLGQLIKEPHFQRIPLRGLTQEDVGTLIEHVGGVTPLQALVEEVHRQTEGNPLFVTEVVRLLAQEGQLTQEPAGEGASLPRSGDLPGQDWSLRIPQGVREAIGRRLNRLSEDCTRTLTVASVLGREFNLEQLNRLTDGLSEDRLLEVLEEALAARVIEELPNAASGYQFTHALIQGTLAGELSAARRARLHRRIGEALEELYGPDPSGHAAELAHHFAQAVVAGNTGKLVRYSLMAGEEALAAYAWEDALAHFERALAARDVPLEGREPAADAEAAALLFGLGRAQAAVRGSMFGFPEYVSNLRRAFDYYVAAGDADRAVAVAEYPIRTALGVAVGAAELTSRALALAPPDSHQAGHLLSTYGLALYEERGDYEGAQESFSRALAIARREEDPALEMRTLAHASNVHYYHQHFQQTLESGLGAIGLLHRVDDPYAEVITRYFMWRALDHMGDRKGVQQHAAAMLAAAQRLRHRGWLGRGFWVSGTLSYHEGNLPEARAFMDRGLVVVPGDPSTLCARTVLEHEAGDFAQGAAYMARLLDATHRSPMGVQFA